MQEFDAIVVGAGAAGLFCAGVAGQSGVRVLVLDHSSKVAEKIRISGGGRCNFTNRQVTAANFLSQNPHFARSALAAYTPDDFTDLLRRHGIAYHEKHRGQLFCDRSAEDLIGVLLKECDAGGVQRRHGSRVQSVTYSDSHAHADRNTDSATGGRGSYTLQTDHGTVRAPALVVATGGLSIPAIGASDLGYRLARQFGLPMVDTQPALVPLCFDSQAWAPFARLAGLSLPVSIATGERKTRTQFHEDLLFTHRGLSGPAVLQISSYWQPGRPIALDLAPGHALEQHLRSAKTQSRRRIANELAGIVPARLADTWVELGAGSGHDWQRPINEASDRALQALAEQLQRWELTPTGTEGYRKAEVTSGGVDTRALSGRTMESRQPGLYFIGEVVDVTGWLGGYNFQWAWSSAYACARALAARLPGGG